MKKAKKTKAPQRRTELDRIVTQLRAALRREVTNVIEIGKLLIESRKHLDHGEWQPWLAKNFDLSYRTALNYVSAAEYVARKGKSETVSHFANLSPGVLYWLAAGHYDAQEEAAILAAAREGRVDQDAAVAICDALAPPENDDDADDQEGDDDAPPEEDPESKEILDGPPPAVPPPAPIPPPLNFALRDFDQAIGTLKRLMTKSAAQFGDTAHTVEDLKKVRDFIRAVADELSKLAEAS
jgi:hypothetical protein